MMKLAISALLSADLGRLSSPRLVVSQRLLATCAFGSVLAGMVGVWLMLPLPAFPASGPALPKALAAADVARLWSPKLKDFIDYGQMGGSLEQAPNVVVYTFHVVGPTFEELWNHYAELCGMERRYVEKTFLVTSHTSAKGSYVVSERASGNGSGGRGPSVFLLETDAYTVAVTFQPDPGGQSISGSLTAVVR